MQRSTDRILTTHTGSMPRPDYLEQAMFAYVDGEDISASDLDALVKRGMKEVVQRQAEVGMDVISDGEVGKVGYATYVSERLNGFGGESGQLAISDIFDYPETAGPAVTDPGFVHLKRPACIGPLSVKDPEIVNREIAAFDEAAQGVEVTGRFLPAVSPATISLFLENQYYPDQESYLYALADVMRPEYQAIIDAGLTLQIDCPDLGLGHVMYAGKSVEEVKRLIPTHVEVLNHALRGLPSDKIRMHVCWGNYPGPHHRDIELKEIVESVLATNADGISLEAANPRHEHEWQVWEDIKLPDGKVLIPGVIDTTNNYIEHPELVAQRIVRYAKVVGRENVLAGSDCGFGTFVGLRATQPSIAWAKLATMVEGAELATRQLW